MDHAEIMNSCSDKAQREGHDALNEVERVVVLVSWVKFEVALGGLDTFYYNSAGDQAVPTVDALEAVGATRAAKALRAANALFPGGSPPRDREKRFDGLVAVRELPNEPLEILEREFDTGELFSQLCAFMEAHAAELSEHTC